MLTFIHNIVIDGNLFGNPSARSRGFRGDRNMDLSTQAASLLEASSDDVFTNESKTQKITDWARECEGGQEGTLKS